MKGRPPVIDRIIDLEKQVNLLLNLLKEHRDRLERLESRIDRMSFKPEPYQPLFDKWVNPNAR